MPEGNRLVLEMLREAERVLDHQVRALESQDHKTSQMMPLEIGMLGAALALRTFAAQSRVADVPFAILLTVSAVANLGALVFLLDAYIGLSSRRYVHVGPRLGWLAEKVLEDEWTMEDHCASLLADFRDYFTHNKLVFARVAEVRRHSFVALFVALGGYLVSAAYILSRAVVQ